MLATLGVGLALAGCGGDDGSSVSSGPKPLDSVPAGTDQAASTTRPESDLTLSAQPGKPSSPPQPKVRNATVAVLVSGVPRIVCRLHATEHFVKTTFGSRGGCVRSTIPASAADSARVFAIGVDGDQATARVIPRGGPSSGEKITVRLVKIGGVWKVDSLRSSAPVGP